MPKYKIFTRAQKIAMLALLVLLASLFLVVQIGLRNRNRATVTQPVPNVPIISQQESQQDASQQEYAPQKGWISRDFTDFDTEFEFRAAFPSNWRISYVEENSSLVLFDPDDPDQLNQSKIIITVDQKSDFSLPNNFHLINSQSNKIKGHLAILYETRNENSQKNQFFPAWSNQQHQILQIRNSQRIPDSFYSFARNPQLSDNIFLSFVDSLLFYDDQSALFPPVVDWQKRINKKPFGIEISPQNSPVQLERFSGYHTGSDFEIFEDELDQDVPVHAVCHGEIIRREHVEGYGGVIIQRCDIEQKPVTVLYGHLSFSAEYTRDVGFYLTAGQLLANLADDQSIDSDGERKHLHLGIFRGQEIDLRGYVKNKSDLKNWIDPESLIQE